MAYDPKLRASDEDRDRTAGLLREHHAVGRLSPEEFSDRLDKTFAATTIGELEALLSDLPRMDLYRLPEAPLTRRPLQMQPRRQRHMPGAWRAAWGGYGTVVLLCFVVWVLSGAGYPWFLWVAGPWGAIMAGSYATYHAARSSRRQLGPGGPGQLPPGQNPPPAG